MGFHRLKNNVRNKDNTVNVTITYATVTCANVTVLNGRVTLWDQYMRGKTYNIAHTSSDFFFVFSLLHRITFGRENDIG